jgi:hypothetical protein
MDESSQSRLTNWYFFTKLKSFVKTCAPVHQAVGTEHRFLAQVWLAPFTVAGQFLAKRLIQKEI